MRNFLLAALAAASIFTGAWAHAAPPPIPPAPAQYVYDEPHALPKATASAVDALLIEHDRATGQQILVAIFNSLQGEELNDRTNEIFRKWGIGQRGKDNGALLAIFWNDHQARIEVGYGLEDTLTDAHSKRILTDFLIPELKAGHPERAIPMAVYQMLVTLDSPLITNGLADRILRGEGRFRGDWTEVSNAPMAHGWWVWLVLGFILMTIVGNILTSAEAHFTGAGWYRPRPWQRKQWSDGISSSLPFLITFLGSGRGDRGWGDRGGGNGGGFLGGGGSSGGGGASGSW
ncbi:MAG: TPM domain-containing protein [Oligoflexia bacterium]|nr:TPM domain-containing protein [Oligoflexia bacterium]